MSHGELAIHETRSTQCFAMAEELCDKFGQPFDVLIPDGRQWWRYACWHAHRDESPSMLDDIEIGKLCHEVRDDFVPRIQRMNDGAHRIGVPIFETGRVVAVAVSSFETDSPDLLLKLAEIFVQHWSEQKERFQEQEENQALAMQVSQDFEELLFLRSVATGLRVNDSASGLKVLAERMLEALNHSIIAGSLVFMCAADETLQPGDIIAAVGDTLANEAICRELVNQFLTGDRKEPLVRNHVGRENEAQPLPGVREFIVVPAMADGHTYGWLIAINRGSDMTEMHDLWHRSQYEFGSHEASLMATSASILATQTSNIELLREKEELLVNVVRSLVAAVEAKDPYTCGHSERVARYAQCIARHSGYSAKEADRLYLTGLLHDIGKIGVSDATLKKPGRLTDEEFDEIKRHPDEGWAILQGTGPLSYVLPGVLQHHERIDGQGYPDGLAGDSISLDGRILAVADAYDAMTSDRPYRKGMPTSQAEGILREGAGTQWDEKIIAAFFDVLDEIHQIREAFRPNRKPNRTLAHRHQGGCQMSQVIDEAGHVFAWS